MICRPYQKLHFKLFLNLESCSQNKTYGKSVGIFEGRCLGKNSAIIVIPKKPFFLLEMSNFFAYSRYDKMGGRKARAARQYLAVFFLHITSGRRLIWISPVALGSAILHLSLAASCVPAFYEFVLLFYIPSSLHLLRFYMFGYLIELHLEMFRF